MEIIPLASESLGARSMATYLRTKDVEIVIDPGVALTQNRYGLPPHVKEEKRREELWGSIKERVAVSDILIITHYHYDHFESKEIEIYEGKVLYIKHPRQMINLSQRRRSSDFLQKVRGLAKEIRYADGLRITKGSTDIVFSKPVYHGISPSLGFVLEVCVGEDERFLFTSDVQGPALKQHVEFILEMNPETLYVDGPVTYKLGEVYPWEYLNSANRNLIEIMEKTNVRRLIVDHHLTRDLNYRKWIELAYEAAEERDVSLITAAEFLGLEPELLEAMRRELYQEGEELGE